MNQGTIIGRLVKDIELSNTKNNKQLAKGSIAVNDSFNKDKTHFFNFTAFGKTAEIMNQYLKKGSQVGLTYSLSHNTWTNKDGQKRSDVSLLVNSFTFCGGKQGSTNAKPQENQNTPQSPQDDFENFDFNDDTETPF